MPHRIFSGLGAWVFPHANRRTTCPPGAIPQQEGRPIIIASPMRAGTHLLIDFVLNNFPRYRSSPLYIDFDAAGKSEMDPASLAKASGCIIKTHYPQVALKPAFSGVLVELARRAHVLTPVREAGKMLLSLQVWQPGKSLDMLEREVEGVRKFWAEFSPLAVPFEMLLDREKAAVLVQEIGVRIGCEPAAELVLAHPSRLRVYYNKLLTRIMGCNAPQVDTSVGYRLRR